MPDKSNMHPSSIKVYKAVKAAPDDQKIKVAISTALELVEAESD